MLFTFSEVNNFELFSALRLEPEKTYLPSLIISRLCIAHNQNIPLEASPNPERNQWIEDRLRRVVLTLTSIDKQLNLVRKVNIYFIVDIFDDKYLAELYSRIGNWKNISIHFIKIDTRSMYTEITLEGANPHDKLDNKLFSRRIVEEILKLDTFPENNYLTITRIDSDDILSTNYIDTIRRISALAINKELTIKPLLIDFPFGLQGDSHNPKMTFFPENHFTTLLLKKSHFYEGITPYSFPHDKIPASIRRLVISTQYPMWWQILHKMNDSNSIFPWTSNELLKYFNIKHM